jgi:FHS family Na+ dependent glucose MFS transporter 1
MRLSSNTRKTAGYYLAILSLGLTHASLGPTLPSLAEQTGTNLGGISFIFSAGSLGYVAGSWLSGRLYDRIPGHRLLTVMLMVMIACLFIIPLASILWLLVLILFIRGLSECSLDVGSNTLLMWLHGKQVGPYMNALHFFFGLGTFTAPLIVGRYFVTGGDLRAIYWTFALLLIPSVVWIAFQPSPEIRKPTEVASHSSIAVPRLFPFIIFLFFLYVGAEITFGGWIYTYSLQMGIGGIAVAAALTSAFWGAFTLGRLASIPIAAVIRPRDMLSIALTGAIACIIIFAFAPNSPVAAWGTTIGYGFFMAPIFPTLMTLTERRFSVTGSMTGWLFVGVGFGGMTIPWVVGQLFERIGPQVMLWIIIATLLIALGVFARVITALSAEQFE